jgi:hypothetical protein
MSKSTAKDSSLPATLDAAEGQAFAIMKYKAGEIQGILKENLGSDAMSAMDLPQISVPSGGGTTFTRSTIDGDVDQKELTGIIICTKHTRAYWKESFDSTGGGTPPDCVSEDGDRGVGVPGGDCSTCPFSQFGSADNKRSKACQEKRVIFMLMPEEILPIAIKAPATSLKNAKQYLMGLTSRGSMLHAVYTTLSLEKDKNKDGIAFSKIVFKKAGNVESPELLATYAESIKPYLMKAVRDIATMRDPMDVVSS